jgi:uncharacterized protein
VRSEFIAQTFSPTYGAAPGLQAIRHNGRHIVVNPQNGAWAVVSDAELAALLHPRQLPRGLAEACYRVGLAHRNGSYATAAPFPADLPMRLIQLNLTLGCNLGCTYCVNDSLPAGGGPRISAAVCEAFVRRVLEYAAGRSLDLLAIEFVGGEPFLEFPAMRYTIELCERLKAPSLHVRYLIQSNFTVIRPAHLDFLRRYDASLGISLDGPRLTQDCHRRFPTGRGSFDAAMAGLARARRKGFPVQAALSVVAAGPGPAGAAASLPGRARFLLDHGFTNLAFVPLKPTGRAVPKGVAAPDPAAYVRELLETFESVLVPEFERTGRMPVERHLALACAYLLEPARRHLDFMAPCGAGWLVTVTMPDGRVFPCNEHPWPKAYCLGSVFDRTFQAMIDSPAAQALRRRTPARIPECRACLYRSWCQSRCSRSALVAHGRLMAPTMYCSFMRELFHQVLLALVDDRFKMEAVRAQAGAALAAS